MRTTLGEGAVLVANAVTTLGKGHFKVSYVAQDGVPERSTQNLHLITSQSTPSDVCY